VFLSSASVSGARTGTVLEGELEMGQSFRSYTEETLARAERMLRRLGAAQPYIVIRPAPVVGDSTSGEVDQLTGPYPYLAVILSAPSDVSMPLPTRGDERFSVVPVDYVAHAVSHLSRHPAAVGKTFHLVDPRAPTVRRALELVATHAGKRVPNAHIPGQVTKALLHTAGLSALGRDQRAYFDVVRTPVQYDTRNADELLESAGISCPPFESYAPALVRHLEERIRKSQAGNAPETSDA
jgi:nucleoside-diphosphate-sugar epimerase